MPRSRSWFSCFTKTSPPHPKDGTWAWLVLLYSSLCGVFVGGILFGYGAILPVLMVAFDENREKIALVGSLSKGVSLFLCVFTTILCERYTCRIVNGVGLMLVVVGLILSSLSKSIYLLYFTYSLLLGIGMSCIFASNFIVVRKYFKKRYSLVTGIMTASAGVGILSFGPFVQYLIDSFGWRNTFRIFAGVYAALVPLTFIFDPNVEKCNETLKPNTTEQHSIDKEVVKPRKMVLGFLDVSVWRFPEYTICVAAIFVGCLGHYTPLIHMIKYSEELGMSASKSSTLLVFVGTGTIVSRLISGRLCDVSYIKPRYVYQAGIVLSGISTISLSFAVNYTHLIIVAIVYGIADGAFRVTMNILFMNTVDIPRKPSAFGQANMVASLSDAAGPAIAGMIADKSGSYTSAFYITGSVSLVSGAIFFLHLCFFRDNTSKREMQFNNITSDHPSACIGPATIEQEETDRDRTKTESC